MSDSIFTNNLGCLAETPDESIHDPASGIDLALDSRALRSLYFCGMPANLADKIHQQEIKEFVSSHRSWFMSLTEMRRISGWQGSGFKISVDHMPQLCDWVKTFSPRRTDDDNLWHGLMLNHAWDHNSRIQSLPDFLQYNHQPQVKSGYA